MFSHSILSSGFVLASMVRMTVEWSSVCVLFRFFSYTLYPSYPSQMTGTTGTTADLKNFFLTHGKKSLLNNQLY